MGAPRPPGRTKCCGEQSAASGSSSWSGVVHCSHQESHGSKKTMSRREVRKFGKHKQTLKIAELSAEVQELKAQLLDSRT
eukprot:10281651-Karenia_brevis.AAC.1